MVYDVWFEDRNCHAQYTGRTLMYTGIEVTLPSYRSNDLMYFSMVGNSYAPYTERSLTVQVTEPSVSTYGGQLGKALNPTTLSGTAYYSLALRFNMSIRDTVLSVPVGAGEGYMERGVQNDYANLISVNGIRLSKLLEKDKDAVIMDYDVYNNVITLYIKKDNEAELKPGKANKVEIDPEFQTFEGVKLEERTGYVLAQNGTKWAKQEGNIYDTNQDGIVDIADVTELLNILSGSKLPEEGTEPDLNGNGQTDIADVTALLNYLSKE